MRPPLVDKALARSLGAACGDEAGRLLHVLAGQRGRARVGQIGAGVDSAWIAAALPPGIPFVLVEPDADRAADATAFFAEDRDARVLHGDWTELLPPEAPFDLLVARGVSDDRLPDLLAGGGTLVTAPPPPGHERLVAVELQVSPRESVIVGTLQA